MNINFNSGIDLLDLIYAAASGEADWPQLIGQLCETVGADNGSLFCWDKIIRQASSLWKKDLQLEEQSPYDSHISHLDQLRSYTEARPVGKWVIYQQVAGKGFVECDNPGRKKDNSSAHYVSGCNLINDATIQVILSFQRCTGKPPFNASELNRLDSVQPHLARSLRLYLKIRGQQKQQSRQQLAQLLSGLGQSTLALEADGTLLFANDDGEQLLHSLTYLTLKQGRVMLQAEKVNRQFQHALHQACIEKGGKELTWHPFDVKGGQHVRINILPFHCDAERTIALVLINTGENPSRLQPTALKEAFGLSPAETRVALAIFSGKTPAEYAAEHKLSIATVRTQLRNVFRKTDCTRQTELVHKLNLLNK